MKIGPLGLGAIVYVTFMIGKKYGQLKAYQEISNDISKVLDICSKKEGKNE